MSAMPGTVSEEPFDYIRDPNEIYRQSFEIVRRETDLAHLPEETHAIAIRFVHTCGDPDIARHMAVADDFVAAAVGALKNGCPILCDVEMVASGITRRFLPAGNDVLVTLNDDRVPGLAHDLATTRSAAAVDLWADRIEGAVVAIGNAPTALFHLMERCRRTGQKPAAVIGVPVGFVGAMESKDALREEGLAPWLTLQGRRGGSAFAAAAVNALTLMARGEEQGT